MTLNVNINQSIKQFVTHQIYFSFTSLKVPVEMNAGQALGMEMLATFLLVFTVFSVEDQRRREINEPGNLAIGFAVTTAIFIAVSVCKCVCALDVCHYDLQYGFGTNGNVNLLIYFDMTMFGVHCYIVILLLVLFLHNIPQHTYMAAYMQKIPKVYFNTEINTFIHQGYIKLINNDGKYIVLFQIN